jgi:N-methylhydantoinase A
LVADLRADFVTTIWRDLSSVGDGHLQGLYAGLDVEARAWLAREEVEVEALHLRRSADLCYVGQSFELNVPLPDDDTPITVAGLTQWFHDRHQAVYGHADRQAPVRLLEARTQIVGVMRQPEAGFVSAHAEAPTAGADRRDIFDRGEMVQAQVVHRSSLAPGAELIGPLVVEQYDTTTYVPAGFRLRVDDRLNMIGERQ